jgi:dUTP pyrophosphatase
MNNLEFLQDDVTKMLENANGLLKDWQYVDGIMKLKIKYINKSKNVDPTYAKDGDSGFDLRANLTDEINIVPGKRMLVPTGLYFQIPLNFELQVRSRSGLALKNGIMVLNSPGTVDSGYRGEVGVILYNTGEEVFTIKNGDRIAQGVIAPVQTLNNSIFIKSDILDSSDRSIGGFGSSGIN